MRNGKLVRRLLGGGVATVGMLAMALPAHAGTVSLTDPSGDALDPVISQVDATTTHTPAPSADITSYSLTSSGRNLTATITVAGAIPNEGSTDPTAYKGPVATGLANTGQEYPMFLGGTYYVAYADASKEKNTYNLTPGCTNLATGAPIYDFQNHWLDGWRDFLAVSVSFDGTAWNYTPQIGRFDPTQNLFGFVDLNAEPNMAGKFSYSHAAGSNQISITVNTDVTTSDDTCVGGVYHSDYGNTGDSIRAVTAYTTTDLNVVLPVAIPLSAVPVLNESDVQAIGGVGYPEDWSNQSGFAIGNGLPYSEQGPTCPTPTFGGTLPRNPTFVDGQPCNVLNPAPGGGQGFRDSGTAMTF